MPAASPGGGVRFRVEGAGELARFAKQLKQADPALRRMLTRDMKAAAQPVAEAVRQQAAAMGLHRAAGAVSVQFRASGRSATVVIVVNARKAPYARAINGGSQGRRTVNRHPVYGHNVWVNQPVRPFFTRGVAIGSPKAGQVMVNAMQGVAVAAGFTKKG